MTEEEQEAKFVRITVIKNRFTDVIDEMKATTPADEILSALTFIMAEYIEYQDSPEEVQKDYDRVLANFRKMVRADMELRKEL